MTLRTRFWIAAPIVLAAAITGARCASRPHHQPHLLRVAKWPAPLPPGFPDPPAPPDNPFTPAKAELGRHLFYDRRLSFNQSQSCADCHRQSLGFTDGRARAIGSTGQEHHRNTMALANVAYRTSLTWANPAMTTLEAQVLVPLTNHAPVELGMDGHFDELVARLRADETYTTMFRAAFPGESDPITVTNAARALASFERTLISGNAPYDRLVRYGEPHALNEQQWRGMRLFFSARLGCSSCHGGGDFASPSAGTTFRDNGTYAGDSPDRGVRDATGRRHDEGLFRVPTLRNVAVTAPYMHDGSAATLEAVIDDYAAGGRAARMHRRRRTGVRPFKITSDEKGDLIAFLGSLTDQTFLADSRFGDPWKK